MPSFRSYPHIQLSTDSLWFSLSRLLQLILRIFWLLVVSSWIPFPLPWMQQFIPMSLQAAAPFSFCHASSTPSDLLPSLALHSMLMWSVPIAYLQ
jgi:hypothetical protein